MPTITDTVVQDVPFTLPEPPTGDIDRINKLVVTRTAGPGSVSFSDMVLWFQENI